MSFQNFRLATAPSQGPPPTAPPAHDRVTPGALLHSIPLSVHQTTHHQPAPQDIADPQQQRHAQTPATPSAKDRPSRSTTSTSKAPYGSGDAEDGYTLVFRNMEEFEQWREKEEIEKMVEFVKGDTHGSKAVPPRFKDHTKLVCARHQRSGRKKYVKKYPDRQRKVPSRKLEGVGCPASISYKTYFETEEIRVMYHEQHSHAIGEANLPFTRRGRRLEAARQKFKDPESDASPTFEVAQPNAMTSEPQASSSSHAQMAPPPSQHQPMLGNMNMRQPPQQQPPPPPQQQQQHQNIPQQGMGMHGHGGGMPGPNVTAQAPDATQDRWDRLDVLFQSIRQHARTGPVRGASGPGGFGSTPSLLITQQPPVLASQSGTL